MTNIWDDQKEQAIKKSASPEFLNLIISQLDLASFCLLRGC